MRREPALARPAVSTSLVRALPVKVWEAQALPNGCASSAFTTSLDSPPPRNPGFLCASRLVCHFNLLFSQDHRCTSPKALRAKGRQRPSAHKAGPATTGFWMREGRAPAHMVRWGSFILSPASAGHPCGFLQMTKVAGT